MTTGSEAASECSSAQAQSQRLLNHQLCFADNTRPRVLTFNEASRWGRCYCRVASDAWPELVGRTACMQCSVKERGALFVIEPDRERQCLYNCWLQLQTGGQPLNASPPGRIHPSLASTHTDTHARTHARTHLGRQSGPCIGLPLLPPVQPARVPACNALPKDPGSKQARPSGLRFCLHAPARVALGLSVSLVREPATTLEQLWNADSSHPLGSIDALPGRSQGLTQGAWKMPHNGHYSLYTSCSPLPINVAGAVGSHDTH